MGAAVAAVTELRRALVARQTRLCRPASKMVGDAHPTGRPSWPVAPAPLEGRVTAIHYPIPIHLQRACAQYGYTRGMLPVTETVTERIVSLPMYPELSAEQIQTVVNVVKKSTVSGISN